jgi:DNA-binding transcriptional regulator YiaG
VEEDAMKCRECGAEMRVGREDWPYPDLPGVILRGVEVRRCVNDAEHHEVELPHMDGLHRALASALLTKRTRLAGPEIRFLRELAAWDATKLATLLDVTPVSLSRWENDQTGHSGMADRLIRMLAAEALGLSAPRDVLEHIGDAAPPSRVALRFGPGGWRVVDESDPVSVWISFADEDCDAVLKALEVSFESLKATVVHFSHHGGMGKTELAAGALSDRQVVVLSGCEEDPGRALRVAMETLRALRPTPERPPAPEAHVES